MPWIDAWLRSSIWSERYPLGLGAILSIVAGILAICDPLLLRGLIDEALPDRSVRMALWLILLIAIVFVLKAVCLSVSTYINLKAALHVGETVRCRLLQHVSRLPLSFHERTFPGDKACRLEKDVDVVANLLSDLTSIGLRGAISFVGNGVSIILLSPKLGLLLLAVTPAVAGVRKRFRVRIQGASDNAQAQAGNSASVLYEVLVGLPQLQLLNAERRGIDRVICAWQSLLKARCRQRKVELTCSGTVTNVVNACMIGALLFGSLSVVKGHLTIGSLVAIYAYVSRIFEPLAMLTDLYARCYRTAASVRRIRAIFLEKPFTPSGTTCIKEEVPHSADVELRHVSFSYPEHLPILRDLSVHICPGEKVALAGESGCGKSTMAKLLVRFIDALDGDIHLAGINIKEYSLLALRQKICYIPQHPVLFTGTIRENLLYGNENASDSLLWTALECVQLTALMKVLPSGLETVIGPHGCILSGGEMQRLALARGILRDSSVIILDESTSAVDVPTERKILQHLVSWKQQSTIIIISHRLTSLTWVDRILVLSDGRITAEGRHCDLIRRKEWYRRLFFGGTVSTASEALALFTSAPSG
jgi:ABC-type multidrug transport system fused ATPase/permease subunit